MNRVDAYVNTQIDANATEKPKFRDSFITVDVIATLFV